MNTPSSIDISGLDKAAVLAALHNGTKPMGMGFLHARSDLSVADARKLIGDGVDDLGTPRSLFGREPLYFDYVCGRPLKVDLSKNSFDPSLYDRDAGEGQAARVINNLRGTKVHADVETAMKAVA